MFWVVFFGFVFTVAWGKGMCLILLGKETMYTQKA